MCLRAVTKLFELIQLAPDRNLVAAAPDSQQNLMMLGTCCIIQLLLSCNEQTRLLAIPVVE